jgi:glycogen synthase
LPYIVAEASYAAKQAHGPWSAGHQQAVRALRQAAAAICLNSCDIPALQRLLGSDNKLHRLMPFLDTSQIMLQQKQALRSEIAQRYKLDPDLPWLMTVAMMRDDVKLSSYQQLATVYERLKRPGQYILVGDGSARSQVEALFSGQLGRHTCFTGQLEQLETLAMMTAGDIFVWPAINEAIGMAILEAQACGLPVVVGKNGAISDIVSDGVSGYICAPNDSRSMAASIAQLLDDASLREQFSLAALDKVSKQHSLYAASEVLETILSEVVS